MATKNLNHWPNSVRVHESVKDNELTHEADKLLVQAHVNYGIKIFLYSVFGLILFLPVAWSVIFSNHVRPGYRLGQQSVAYTPKSELKGLLEKSDAGLIMEVPSLDNSVQQNILLKSSDVNAKFDVDKTTELVFQETSQIPHIAFIDDIRRMIGPKQIPRVYQYDETRFNDVASLVHDALNWPAESASVIFKDGVFIPQEEVPGSTISEEAVRSELARGFSMGAQTLIVPAVKTEAKIKIDLAEAAASNAAKMINKEVNIHVYGVTIKPSTQDRGLWIGFKENITGPTIAPYVDENLVEIYLSGIENKYRKNGNPLDISAAIAVLTNEVQNPGSDGNVNLPTVSGKALRTPPRSWKRYVEVNLSKQHFYIIRSKKVIYHSAVITSQTLGETRPGIFRIYHKARNRYLVGRGYRLWVDYWMPYDGLRGLHDAQWRPTSQFKDPKRWRACCGSHGCINMPHKSARKLYAYAPLNTPVWVHY